MSSRSLKKWKADRSVALDEIQSAHEKVGGSGPGRRYATQQLNQAYALLLSSQFQGFCRDLHSESVDYIVSNTTAPAQLRIILRAQFTFGRQLDRGNPNPGNIGNDFNRLGLDFWGDVKSRDARHKQRNAELEKMNSWRNAIAHHDFDVAKLGSSRLLLKDVERWRGCCNSLAVAFDAVMGAHLNGLLGASPW